MSEIVLENEDLEKYSHIEEGLKLSVLHQDDGDVPEIFYTIQGEGRGLGLPSVFVRTSDCNLRCGWCDTPQTWNWADGANVREGLPTFERHNEQMTLDAGDVAGRILSYGADRVVLTGGEPMMQQAGLIGTLLIAKAAKLEKDGRPLHSEIETNGTIFPRGYTVGGQEYSLIELNDQFNVSPKLSSSDNYPRKALKMRTLKRFSELGDKANFKFVVGTEQDSRDVVEIVREAEIDPAQVLIMPEGRTRAELQAKAERIVEYCKNKGFGFSPRLHIDIWGDKKGV